LKKKYILLFIAYILFLPLHNNNAYASSRTSTLVNSAIKAGNSLSNLTTVDKKATGKNIPIKEYKNSLKKYKSAKLQVNKLSNSQKRLYLHKLDRVRDQIDRGKSYITAVSAGKKLNKKTEQLEKYSKGMVLNNKTLNAYSSLSNELKSSSENFTAVYDSKTRSKIYKLYKTPAENATNRLQKAITVKQAIDRINKLVKSKSSPKNITNQYKIIVLNIDLIQQSAFKNQLKSEVKKLNALIPANVKKGQLADLILIEIDFEQLDTLLSPGKSNQKVPAIYDDLTNRINRYPTMSERYLLKKRFSKIMSQIKISTKELKGLMTKVAMSKGIPPEIVKAIAITENGKLQQFTTKGEVFRSTDNGYGIMQVTPLSPADNRFDWNRVKYDLSYNIATGVSILLEKWGYSGSRIPMINNQEKGYLENWYFAVMAYNGLSMRNIPNGSNIPYQEKVYDYIERLALLEDHNFDIGKIVVSENPITHLPSFSTKMKYTTKTTRSTQLFLNATEVKIKSLSKFRNTPSTSSSKVKSFPAGTRIKILDGPIEDNNPSNLFCWFQVSITGYKGVWYVASSNLK
jgi:hypothetical protein